MNGNDGIYINYVLSMLLKKIIVPGNYHSQVGACEEMGMDDISGLVDSLTDFQVESASVEYGIETDNDNLTKLLKKWLDKINFGSLGIPTGINPLAEEYFKERWKTSSFPILKMAKWENIGSGVIVPTQMFFVDGKSIHASEKDSNSENVKLVNYDYKLGTSDKAEKLNKNVIITKPFARWTDKYPVPYLVKRGIYHNWKIIASLKNKEWEILEQIIPYMMLVKKGTDSLAVNKNVHYSDTALQGIIEKLEVAVDKYKELDSKNKMMVRATNFDESLEHLIPDLRTIFDAGLFASAEKNILAGLGFIDIAEAVTASRRESILNPKPFIQETKKGVKDFKQIVKEMVMMVIEKNKSKKKYFANEIRVTSSPVTGFMTDKFKERIRQCWDRGKISNKTAVEIIAEVDFDTEVKRREQEAKDGIDTTMYPNVTENREGTGMDLPGDPSAHPEKQMETQEAIPDAKKGTEAKNFKASTENPDEDHLEGAPYSTIKNLPPKVRENLNLDLQRVYLKVFNRAFNTYENDTISFRVAWALVKKIAKQDKDGQWVRKVKSAKGKKKKVALSKAMIEQAIAEAEKGFIDDAFAMNKLTMSDGKKELLNKLTKKKSKDR